MNGANTRRLANQKGTSSKRMTPRTKQRSMQKASKEYKKYLTVCLCFILMSPNKRIIISFNTSSIYSEYNYTNKYDDAELDQERKEY